MSFFLVLLLFAAVRALELAERDVIVLMNLSATKYDNPFTPMFISEGDHPGSNWTWHLMSPPTVEQCADPLVCTPLKVFIIKDTQHREFVFSTTQGITGDYIHCEHSFSEKHATCSASGQLGNNNFNILHPGVYLLSVLPDKQWLATVSYLGNVSASCGTCSGNGTCDLLQLVCTCHRERIPVTQCGTCECPTNHTCDAQGRCTNRGAIMPHQGLVTLHVELADHIDTSWECEKVFARVNPNYLTSQPEYWRNIPLECKGNKTLVWADATFAANLAQFVVFHVDYNVYVHCIDIDGLPLVPALGGGYRGSNYTFCKPTGNHDGKHNFVVLTAGEYIIFSNGTLKTVRHFPIGCQGEVGSHDACGKNGACDSLFSSCACNGNWKGPDCLTCEGCANTSKCAAGTGKCICLPSLMTCDTGCYDSQSDINNCGWCSNKCGGDGVANATCTYGRCNITMEPKFSWVICFGDDKPGALKVCCTGWNFIVQVITAAALSALCGYCLFRLYQKSPRTHQHRKRVFILLLVTAIVRTFYALGSVIVVSTFDSPQHVTAGKGFFADSMVTVSAFADLCMACIDLTLTVFWLRVLDKLSDFPSKALTATFLVMFVSLGIASIIDYANSPLRFDYTFFFVALVLFFTAVLHLIVVIEVLSKLKEFVTAASLIDFCWRDEASKNLRGHFLRVASIATVTFVCWVMRSAALIGRAAQVDVFVHGSMSFENDHYTMFYFSILTLLPCYVICIAFFRLSLDIITEHNGSSLIHRIESTPGVTTPISRISRSSANMQTCTPGNTPDDPSTRLLVESRVPSASFGAFDTPQNTPTY